NFLLTLYSPFIYKKGSKNANVEKPIKKGSEHNCKHLQFAPTLNGDHHVVPTASQLFYLLRPIRFWALAFSVFNESRSALYIFLHFAHWTEIVALVRRSANISLPPHHGQLR